MIIQNWTKKNKTNFVDDISVKKIILKKQPPKEKRKKNKISQLNEQKQQDIYKASRWNHNNY